MTFGAYEACVFGASTLLTTTDFFIFLWPVVYSVMTHWYTAWKVSKYGAFSGLYFPSFSSNTEKYGPEITRYLYTFHVLLQDFDWRSKILIEWADWQRLWQSRLVDQLSVTSEKYRAGNQTKTQCNGQLRLTRFKTPSVLILQWNKTPSVN